MSHPGIQRKPPETSDAELPSKGIAAFAINNPHFTVVVLFCGHPAGHPEPHSSAQRFASDGQQSGRTDSFLLSWNASRSRRTGSHVFIRTIHGPGSWDPTSGIAISGGREYR